MKEILNTIIELEQKLDFYKTKYFNSYEINSHLENGEIESVKRLIDNAIFKVGDTVRNKEIDGSYFIIRQFTIIGDSMFASSIDTKGDFNKYCYMYPYFGFIPNLVIDDRILK